jgi:hypothetical protein
MRALGAYEGGICACGFHSSLTSDPANFFTFEDSRCNVCKEAARYARIQNAADDEDEKRAGDNPPVGRVKPADGRRTFLKRIPDPRK